MSLSLKPNRPHPLSALTGPRQHPHPVDLDRVLDEQAKKGLKEAYEVIGKEMIQEVKDARNYIEILNGSIKAIFERAQENGDDLSALNDWAERYRGVFLRSNRTRWAFNQIKWDLRDILNAVAGGDKMTETAWHRASFQIKKHYQPPNKTEGRWWEEQISSGINIFNQVLDGEMWSVQQRHQIQVDPSSLACTISYPGQLREALGPMDTNKNHFTRKDWLKRDHELRVLNHLRMANLPMLEGQNMLPLFDIENVKRRISEWKPPSVLLPRKVQFHVVARNNEFASVHEGPGGWREDFDHA